jgi:hypothetical protein
MPTSAAMMALQQAMTELQARDSALGASSAPADHAQHRLIGGTH